jgi:CHAT domain-containing protein
VTGVQTCALPISREFRLRRNEGVDFNNIGAVHKTAGNWQKAIASFDSAYSIAKEVGNRRDEAIALNNRALLEKLTGHQDLARKDYEEALALYHEVQFFEGAATALMGLASLDAEEKNFPAALEKLLQAKEIYEEQALPPQIALAYIQLGLLYQKMARPDRRVTRDLVFEDIDDNEMVPIEIAPNEALAISEGYFVKAGELASKYSLTQSLWKALQGQAFAAKEKGELAKAEGLYSKAIDIVLSTKGIEDNPELLLFYLQDKEDLFQLAMEACSDLYKQTKDESLLIKQMEYDEIYRNEILKANMQMSNMEYTDPEKRSLFESLVEIDAQRKKAEKAAQTALMEMGSAKPSQAAATANDEAKVEAQRLDFEYEKYLVQWRDKYPQDRVLFDTMEKIDLKKIQQIIKNDEALIQYIPLENELDVIVITKENIEMKDLKIKYNDLYNTIIIELMGGRIENYGHSKNYYPNNYFRVETEEYNKAIEIFEELYVNIYKPIEKLVNNKKKLYFLTSKYVSYIPFAALVTGRKINNDPIFLAQSKAVALIRFSFINKLLNEQNNNKIHRNYRIISVGNPKHDKFPMADLDGAKQEAENSINIINNLYNEYEKDNKLLIEYEALKNTWIEKIRSKKFGIFYFATHGVPYAEVIYTKKWFENNIAKNSDNNNLSIDDQKDLNDKKLFVEFCNKVFTNTSHLNGFLYMAYNADENKDIELEFNTSGLLTLKDILSLDDDIFSEANLAILSACNTGVSISAKIFRNKKSKEYIDEFKSDEGIKILKDSGWVPDIDEVCLVDSFMRRNFKYVYGTLWFADDESSNYLLTAFMNNLKKYDDIIIAYNEAQKFYLDNTPVIRGNDTKLHPFFWANGNIFGY